MHSIFLGCHYLILVHLIGKHTQRMYEAISVLKDSLAHLHNT